MGISGTTWGIVLQKQLSWGRIGGMALFWTWMMVVFYSIVPYAQATDVRATLYASQLFSLVAMVCTMLFAALVVRRGDALASSKPVLLGSAGAMCVGTTLTVFADNATVNGTLLLGFGSVLTGSGSAVMLLCWAEVLSWQGERLALVELAASSAVGFALAFLLLLAPVAVADVATVLLCVATAAALYRFGACGDAATFQADEREGSGRAAFSRATIGLFAKALCGVALVGFIAGFFDVLSGYKTFVVQDAYGLWLYLAGLLVSLVLLVIAVFLHHDSAFFGYRTCLLLMCLGCLLAPFLLQSTNVGALLFGGYHGYALVVCSIGVGVATSFRVGTVRALGLGYVALYGGELLGSVAAHALNQLGETAPDLALLTLVAVSLLFISHLFLFTETDLVKIGIGEVNLSAPARRKLEALGGKLPGREAAVAAGALGGEGVLGGVSGEVGCAVADASRSEDGVAAGVRSGDHAGEGGAPLGEVADASGYEGVAAFSEGAGGVQSGAINAQRYMGCAVVTAVADALTSELLSAGQGAEGSAEPAPVDPAPVMVERFGLSPRESDVLPLLLEGRTIARIQEALFISQGTVSTHIRHIYQKTGTRNRQELIDLAHKIAEERTAFVEV